MRPEPIDEELARWRREQLRGAGFPLELASQVVHDGGYDIHALVELTERGCPPALAARILAPLVRPESPPTRTARQAHSIEI